MFKQRTLIVLTAVVLLAVTILYGLNTAPTYAAANVRGTDATTIHLAPPGAGPTLAPRTPILGGIPPIDLGALNSPKTPSPTPVAEGTTNEVINYTYDSCNPYDDEFIRLECVNGALAFTRKETAGTRYVYYKPTFTDALIEVTARLPSQKNARYGVVFRLDDAFKNFYLLGVTNEGKYGLFRFAQDHYETIIPYTESFSVGNASFPSKIKIVNQGDVIAFSIGGQWIDSIRDPNLQGGRVALFLEPDEPNQTVLFDDFRVSEITSPLQVPQPRDVLPPATPTPTTSSGSDLPIFSFDTATPSAAQPTQTPFVIVVTATPQPAIVRPTTKPVQVQPTRRPTTAPSCPAGANESLLYISNNYIGSTMRFTIGGGEWGTHDYDVPGDGQYYIIHMPPGKYTYTAFIPGKGQAHGEKTNYGAGQCASLRFSP